MTIASEITRIQNGVASAYSSVSTKGGTLPATQNLNNLPSAIESIPSGGGSKYGCTVDNLLGDVNASGVLQKPSDTSGDIVFTGVKDVGPYALQYKFYYNTNLTHGVSFPNLENVSGSSGCEGMFNYCSYLTSANLSALTTVSGSSGCRYMFMNCSRLSSVNLSSLTSISNSSGCGGMFTSCSQLTSVDLSSLQTVYEYGCNAMFNNCSSLRNVDLSSLTSINLYGCYSMFYGCSYMTSVNFSSLTGIGNYGCYNMFCGCNRLSHLIFPALTTSSFRSYTTQFSNMFNSSTAKTSGTCTLHFPSNLSSTIAGLIGYPLFGGTSGKIVLAFDLPATS